MTLEQAKCDLKDSEVDLKTAVSKYGRNSREAFDFLVDVTTDLQHLVDELIAELTSLQAERAYGTIHVVATVYGLAVHVCDDELALAPAAHAACEEVPLV